MIGFNIKQNATRFASQRSGGFTLVEMLITITIIALIASIVLFTMTGAVNSGKEARTQSQIYQLQSIILQIWEKYPSRVAPVHIPLGMNRRQAAAVKLNARRELMRMELPDRISDVREGPSVLPARPSLSAGYLRRGNRAGWTSRHQGAECLYMIVALYQDGPRNGLEFFSQNEIGDVDGDGMPEILDGWGNPIEFLRWAPGLVDSPLQPNDPVKNPDPCDPLNIQSGTFGLIPLIFSAGSDGKYNIKTDKAGAPVSYSQTTPKNNPYQDWGGGLLFGAPNEPNSDGHYDNITNHSSD